MTNIWFTSDHHFGHRRIVEYAKRPFADTVSMDEALVQNWNLYVRPGDLVYHLGDFAFIRPDEISPLVRRLNGVIHLVHGNHDRFLRDKRRELSFAWVGPYKEIKVADQKIVLCHYPFLTWNGRHHGSWDLHGHCHASLPDDPGSKRLDIGVDAVALRLGKHPEDYRPMEYQEVEVEMQKKGINPVDHHELRGGDDEEADRNPANPSEV